MTVAGVGMPEDLSATAKSWPFSGEAQEAHHPYVISYDF